LPVSRLEANTRVAQLSCRGQKRIQENATDPSEFDSGARRTCAGSPRFRRHSGTPPHPTATPSRSPARTVPSRVRPSGCTRSKPRILHRPTAAPVLSFEMQAEGRTPKLHESPGEKPGEKRHLMTPHPLRKPSICGCFDSEQKRMMGLEPTTSCMATRPEWQRLPLNAVSTR